MDRRASGLIALSGASLPLASCWPLPPLHFEARGLPRSKAVIFPVSSPALSALWTPPGLFCALFSRRRKENRNFFEKKYCFFGRVMVLYQSRHDATEYGRLAQLVEHLLDVQEVTGSSPVPSTIQFVLEPDSLRKRVRVRFLFTGGSAKGLLGTVNEQRQGIIVAMASCLLFCGIKFALCELGRSPIWRMGVIAAYVRTERSCTPLARCNTLDFVPKSVC